MVTRRRRPCRNPPPHPSGTKAQRGNTNPGPGTRRQDLAEKMLGDQSALRTPSRAARRPQRHSPRPRRGAARLSPRTGWWDRHPFLCQYPGQCPTPVKSNAEKRGLPEPRWSASSVHTLNSMAHGVTMAQLPGSSAIPCPRQPTPGSGDTLKCQSPQSPDTSRPAPPPLLSAKTAHLPQVPHLSVPGPGVPPAPAPPQSAGLGRGRWLRRDCPAMKEPSALGAQA